MSKSKIVGMMALIVFAMGIAMVDCAVAGEEKEKALQQYNLEYLFSYTAKLDRVFDMIGPAADGFRFSLYGTPMMASSGYVAQVDETLCVACDTCKEACPFGAIQVDGMAVVKWEACMGCGVCMGQCPNKAVSLVRDERKGAPLDVRLLAQAKQERTQSQI